MRFVTFREGGTCRAGLLAGDAASPDDTVYDLAHPDLVSKLGGARPDLMDMLAHDLAVIAARLADAGLAEAGRLRLGDVELLAPLPSPPRIFGAAYNFHCALEERGMPAPPEPVLFTKAPETITGPRAPIILPQGIGGVTYEAELAAVIGKGGCDIPVERALDHIAGYTIFNDISASEIIRADGNFDRGKNYPAFGPLGPYLATADEIADPQALRVTLMVDGEVLQDGSTSRMVFGVSELVSILSRARPLQPGDIIATGTPAGVAPARTPRSWLRPGTVVSAAVEGLGTLSNPVVEGPPPHG